MEEKTIEVSVQDAKFVYDKHILFDYKCLEEKTIGNKIVYRFSRDDSVSYIDDLRKLEQEYGEVHIGKPILMFVFPIISFILLTVLLVLLILGKLKENMLLYLLTILLPAALLFMATFLVTYLYWRKIKNLPEQMKEKEEKYRKKIEELKNVK